MTKASVNLRPTSSSLRASEDRRGLRSLAGEQQGTASFPSPSHPARKAALEAQTLPSQSRPEPRRRRHSLRLSFWLRQRSPTQPRPSPATSPHYGTRPKQGGRARRSLGRPRKPQPGQGEETRGKLTEQAWAAALDPLLGSEEEGQGAFPPVALPRRPRSAASPANSQSLIRLPPPRVWSLRENRMRHI